MDTITIKDLSVLCKIGVPDEERANPQRLLITVEMSGDFSRAAQADEIARMLVGEFRAEQATVEIKKFILSNARHVSFRLTRTQ